MQNVLVNYVCSKSWLESVHLIPWCVCNVSSYLLCQFHLLHTHDSQITLV